MSDWWTQNRKVSVVVDNDSWILPAASRLVEAFNAGGDEAKLCRAHDEIMQGGVAFYLGCVKITPPDILARNHRNLVVHASDLPKGRGMSPWTWQVLEGAKNIPVCLLDAEEEVDSGAIVYKDFIALEGGELVDDLRAMLSDKTFDLCMRFLSSDTCAQGQAQTGEPSYYKRRGPEDSQLDVDKTIADQFPLLRVVDNDNYPAFFEMNGQKYILKIYKDEND